MKTKEVMAGLLMLCISTFAYNGYEIASLGYVPNGANVDVSDQLAAFFETTWAAGGTIYDASFYGGKLKMELGYQNGLYLDGTPTQYGGGYSEVKVYLPGFAVKMPKYVHSGSSHRHVEPPPKPCCICKIGKFCPFPLPTEFVGCRICKV